MPNSVQPIVPSATLNSPMEFSAPLSPDALMVYLETRLNGLDDQIDSIFNTEKNQAKVQESLRAMQVELGRLDGNADSKQVLTMPGSPTVTSSEVPPPPPALPEGTPPEGTPPPRDEFDSTPGVPPDTTASDTSTTAGGQSPSNPTPPPGQVGNDVVKNLEDSIDAIRRIDPHLADNIEGTLAGDGFILAGHDATYFSSEVNATKDYLTGLSKDVESSSQMNMIQLQSLMSARQTAVQLATNLISALAESSKAIAANLGK